MMFISRHEPTQEQYDLALEAGYHLIPVGDVDAFAHLRECAEDAPVVTTINDLLTGYADADVCCVHPLYVLTAMLKSIQIKLN